VLRSNTRALDTLFRYGGEEFVIVPLKVDLASGMIVAEKLRLLVAQHQYVNDLKITISIGVAQYRVGETAEAWIARADAALYKAKDAGRNKVMSAMV
jgi:diguanylate cyclase (GGDEF)-like protein